ncbi:Phage-related protein [Cupriavidus taiwanensis]|uniref:Phage-related protein n=1 Tax=Cupriavidus taiwanensis TaxID=164546 RepID=A0A375IH35_9BURK|nr:hypothetical protein [Cupriavidus taiwanensis]SPK72692.1 Phage-related protein [Cupriavidus taiwanensis]
MKTLTALQNVPTAYLDRYVAIRDKKKTATKTPLIVAHDVITQCYEDYAQAIALGALAGLVGNVQAAQLSGPLRACYDSPTQPLRELKQAIHEAQPKRLLKYCPMCGTTLPRTFDHYMPAVKFPEFAVHPLNLVPCCATCNSTKDADWLTPAGARQYLHAYSDQLPDLQFLSVQLHENAVLQGVGATFSMQRPRAMPNALWPLIVSHFTRLNLIARYDERGNDEIAEILSVCRVHLDAGGPDARTFLQGLAEDRKAVFGRNHWIAVLMEAMAQHPNLINWVNAA